MKSFNNKPILYIPILIFAIIAFIWVNKFSSIDNKHYDTLTEKTQGTVTYYSIEKTRHKSGYHYWHNVTFDYEIDGKKYTLQDSYSGPSEPIAKVGDKIDILYNKNNNYSAMPEEFINYDKESNKTSSNAFIGIIIVTAILFIFSLLSNKSIKQIQ